MAKDLSPSTYPLTPPLTEEEWHSWLRLLRSRRVGIATFYRLLEEHGNAAAALDALPQVAAEAGVKNYQIYDERAVHDEWHRATLAGAKPIAIGSAAYPELLAQIPDPPPILWCLGRIELLQKATLAIVGARNASSLGTRMAKKIASELGKSDMVIASGLARGVDTAAHLAALETGTIAVMAGGVDVIYPKENTVLAQEIEEKGLIVSEMPIGTVPQARHFPNRNRIISGLARATIVVEAAAKSGSLITARTALDQGRDVHAVPGHPFDARASGCNMLIRDGATLVRGARDIIEALEEPVKRCATPKQTPKKPTAVSHDIKSLHAQILDRLGPSPIAEDQLIRDLKAHARTISPEISALELDGKIQRQPGGLLSRVVEA